MPAAPAALPLSPARMLAVRDSVNPETPYESYCHDAASALAAALSAAGCPATVCDAGTVRDPSHCYALLDDGTIVDPTLDQFYPGGRGNSTGDWTSPVWVGRDPEPLPSEHPSPGQVAVLPADHPFARHYHSHRREQHSWMYPDGYWVSGREPAWWQRLHPA